MKRFHLHDDSVVKVQVDPTIDVLIAGAVIPFGDITGEGLTMTDYHYLAFGLLE